MKLLLFAIFFFSPLLQAKASTPKASTCTRKEYREEYIPGTQSSPGYVKNYEVDVEIWPTSIVVPKGYRIGLTIKGQDYVNQSGGGSTLPNMNKFSGCGPFLHDDPIDRPNDTFGKKTTLHFSRDQKPYLLLPIIKNQN